MKKIIATLLLGCTTASAAACTNAKNSDTTWQISQVYLNPETPAGLPDHVSAVMVLGGSTVTGDTGCTPFQGKVAYDREAQKVTFSHMKFREANCVGAERYFHDALVTLLDGEFEQKQTESELLLTKSPGGLNAPSIRLVATN